MPVTRVVASSAGRTGGDINSYDANLPWEIRGVTSVSLVAATVPYPPAMLVPGAYAVLRIDGMEVTASNDGVLDRCFVALPCVDNIQKVLPTTYWPSRPLRRLNRLRVSLVDQRGEPIDFQGQDHILQFDVEWGGTPHDRPPKWERSSASPNWEDHTTLPMGAEADPAAVQPYEWGDTPHGPPPS